MRLLGTADRARSRARVALTFDACDGHVDRRILDMLIGQRIAATIFVSGLWLRRNADSFAELLAHPDLFEIGNHGARHRAAIDRNETLWGVRAAGSELGVEDEVRGGANLLIAAGAPNPVWYRGAAATYTRRAMADIVALGCRIAGFSLNGDQGAGLGAATTRARILGATDGEVIIAHINQPGRSAGAGVAEGVLGLRAQGMDFLRLSDGPVGVAG